jgi:hypothetical protein
MEAHAGLDHLVLSVHDYYTESSISGVHIFSNRCTWENSNDNVFVDHNPAISGHRQLFFNKETSSNLVTHAFQQSDEDAIAFGVHKFSKVLQNQDFPYSYSQLLNHWGNINLLIKMYGNQHDKKRKLAICAVLNCITKSIDSELQLNQDNYKKAEKFILDSEINIERFVESASYRIILLTRLLGLRKVAYMAIYKIYRLHNTGEAQPLETPKCLRADRQH